MTTIHVHNVVRSSSDRSPFRGSYRVIFINHRVDSIWLIQIERADGLPIQYHARPRCYSLKAIESLSRQLLVQICSDAVPVQWLQSDTQIQRKYERSGADGECSQLRLRRKRWEIIEPIIRAYTVSDLLERRMYHPVVWSRAQALGVSVKKVAALVHLYWAGGAHANSLLPCYHRSGAPGKIRDQKAKMGRGNVAVQNAKTEFRGFRISKGDREQLQFGWQTFNGPNRTVRSAYLRTMEVFYREGEREEEGRQIAILKPTHERPSLRQFRYWGAQGQAMQAAFYLQMSKGDFEKNHRPLPGTSRDGIQAVGQLAYCDATTNDVNLMSVVSRLRPVGTANRIMIVDAYSGLWAGIYCGFDAPSARTALLAAANAALDKVDFCARFDIKISSDMWPAVGFSRYLGDNGEFRCEACIEAMTGLGSVLEFAPVGRADLKGPVETSHNVLHSRLDHKLDGTTFGRESKRGEDRPAMLGSLTYFEYMRHLIFHILHHNNRVRCEHLLTTEMRRDGVEPTRSTIFRWCVENGYLSGPPPSTDLVRAHLLPALPAILTGSGVFLMRPDRGRKVELVHEARFVGEVLVEKGLMLKARRNHTSIEVRGDPEDMRRVWLVHDGVHELHNVSLDPLQVKEWTLRDHLAVMDQDALGRHVAQTEYDQAESNLDTRMFADLDRAKLEKTAELERLAVRPSKKARVSDIRRNREAEKALLRSGGGVKKQHRGGVGRIEHGKETKQPSATHPLSPSQELLRKFRQKWRRQ